MRKISVTAAEENGIFLAIDLGRKARGGIRSRISGIGIIVPFLKLFSLKNFPSSTHRFAIVVEEEVEL
ncbi:hypothetical protein HPP92_006264 [Vanilla planifolia]|uniref:Uncharacterized protein n=1 Tax=Vanilla planifolia TaxID=51239 RepID=A0A835VDY5_VANPL|nr:hypothetical protein HPP92_006264 [Vanilla planifolia]